MLLLLTCPSSPSCFASSCITVNICIKFRWLIRQDRDEEAFNVLQKIRGSDVCIEKEFNKLRDQCCKDRQSNLVSPDFANVTPIQHGTTSLSTPTTSALTSSGPSYIRSISANSAISTTSEDSAIVSDPGFWTILSDVLKDRYLRRALAVGCVLQAVQQLTGINTVMYYAATIIQMSGVGNKNEAVWMASITAMVNFVTTFFGIYLVDRLGRRKLTLGSLAGVAFSLLILSAGFRMEKSYSPLVGFKSDLPVDALCSSSINTCSECIDAPVGCGFCYDPNSITNGTCLKAFNAEPDAGSQSFLCRVANSSLSLASSFNRSSSSSLSSAVVDSQSTSGQMMWSHKTCPAPYSYIILGGLCLYLLAFGPGMGPMPWTINSEIYPTWSRTTCCSITTSMSWFFNLLISLTFLTLVDTITKEGAFGLYSLFGMIGFVFLYFKLPETKGKHLEETYAMFRRKSSRRRAAKRKALQERLNIHQEEQGGVSNPQFVPDE